MGCPGIESSRWEDIRIGRAMVGSSGGLRHPLVPFTRICSSVGYMKHCESRAFLSFLSDIKPQNFVLTSYYRLLLIDFGSAAPLLPAEPDGSRLIPHQYCLVPCGTCDYISPEILQAHEDALVALELSDESSGTGASPESRSSCGLETDWWSFGAMIYELAFGITPFFAKDVRTTYLRIMDHEVSVKSVCCLLDVKMSTD